MREEDLADAIHHYSQAKAYGWLALTAAYLYFNQPQSALLVLQHAVAHSYRQATDSCPEAEHLTQAAVKQLCEAWLELCLDMARDKAVPGGVVLLVFPAKQQMQLGASQVSSACLVLSTLQSSRCSWEVFR